LADGYVKLYRKLLTSPTFDNPAMLKVFIWCLLKATRQEREQVVGLQIAHLVPGQFIFGRVKDAEELKMHPSSLYRIIQRLEMLGNLNINSNSKFSVITVANWELYQDEYENLNINSNSKRTTDEQQMNTNKKVKKVENSITSPIIPNGDEEKAFNKTSKPYRCAAFLNEQISIRLPQRKEATEKVLQSWADDFDKTNRIDGYKWELIGEVLEFSQQEEFWQKNILSGAAFRKQFVKLYSKMGESK
jgi:hypothetical protein